MPFEIIAKTNMNTSLYCNKRNAWSLPGVINHYAKSKIMHNVYFAFSEGKLRNPTRKLWSKNMTFVGNIISPWKYFAHMNMTFRKLVTKKRLIFRPSHL